MVPDMPTRLVARAGPLDSNRISHKEAFYRKKEQLIMSALLKEKVLGESAVQS
jgi:hypothetical protein